MTGRMLLESALAVVAVPMARAAELKATANAVAMGRVRIRTLIRTPRYEVWAPRIRVE
ncbi:hypothetical protein GCM10010317_073020 [Streptomyces mirabilis]|nr:hypothetical protein GCM10010317_073020 [Streptomyces mirabilis]